MNVKVTKYQFNKINLFYYIMLTQKDRKNIQLLTLIIYIALTFWGITKAMKIKNSEDRRLHMIGAAFFGPIYLAATFFDDKQI